MIIITSYECICECRAESIKSSSASADTWYSSRIREIFSRSAGLVALRFVAMETMDAVGHGYTLFKWTSLSVCGYYYIDNIAH